MPLNLLPLVKGGLAPGAIKERSLTLFSNQARGIVSPGLTERRTLVALAGPLGPTPPGPPFTRGETVGVPHAALLSGGTVTLDLAHRPYQKPNHDGQAVCCSTPPGGGPFHRGEKIGVPTPRCSRGAIKTLDLSSQTPLPSQEGQKIAARRTHAARGGFTLI